MYLRLPEHSATLATLIPTRLPAASLLIAGVKIQLFKLAQRGTGNMCQVWRHTLEVTRQQGVSHSLMEGNLVLVAEELLDQLVTLRAPLPRARERPARLGFVGVPHPCDHQAKHGGCLGGNMIQRLLVFGHVEPFAIEVPYLENVLAVVAYALGILGYAHQSQADRYIVPGMNRQVTQHLAPNRTLKFIDLAIAFIERLTHLVSRLGTVQCFIGTLEHPGTMLKHLRQFFERQVDTAFRG